MGFLKDLIWENPEAEAAAPTEGSKAAPAPTSRPMGLPSVNSEMAAAIKKATLAKKTPFTALLEASDKMASAIPDTVTRLKAAYAMIAGDSRSLDQISKAVDVHMQDIEGEVLRFNQLSKNKRISEVGSLQTRAQSLIQTNENLQREVADLEQRLTSLRATITENQAQAQTVTAEVQTKEAEIIRAETEFQAAAQEVRNEFEQQRRVILSTLK